MIDESARRARIEIGERAVPGLLTTDGTLQTRLYHDALSRHGITVVTPRAEAQRAVMGVIAEVKLRGVPDTALESLSPATDDFADQGATALVAGCTEIALVLGEQPPALPWLNPLQVLAERLIEEASRP